MPDEKISWVSCGKISPEFLAGLESIEDAPEILKNKLGTRYPKNLQEIDKFTCESEVFQELLCKSLNFSGHLSCQRNNQNRAYPYYKTSVKTITQIVKRSTATYCDYAMRKKSVPQNTQLQAVRLLEDSDYVFNWSDVGQDQAMWSINTYLSDFTLAQMFFNNSKVTFIGGYIRNRKFCWMTTDNGSNTLAYYGNNPQELETLQEEALKSLRPSIDYLTIHLPENFDGYKKFPEIMREDVARNSTGEYSQSSEYFGDPDFEIELDLMDAVLLRYLMSLYGANYDHLRPLENIEGGEAFYRRRYAFSEASILFYGDRAVSALKKIANGDVNNETKISLLILAKKIDEMSVKVEKNYKNQQSRAFDTVFTPPPLNLPMMDQALSAVFPKADSMTPIYQEVDRIFDDLDTETGNQVVFVDAFDQSSFIRETPWDFASWNGLHMDELKVVYFAIKSLKRLSGAHNIKSTSVQVENKFPEESESPSIICVKSQNSNASMECRFRKDQYWKDLIGRLKQLKEASNYSYGLKARLDQLVKQAEDLYITLTDESGPEVARKSAWGSYGSLPYTLGVGLFGAVVGAVVTVFVKEPLTTWYKSRKKSDKDDDDSNPPGVAAKGREGIVSESQGADSKFQVEPAVNFDLERLNAPVSTQSNQQGSYHIPQFDKIGVARSYFEEAIPYIGVGAAIAGTALVVGTALIRAGERLAVSGPPAPPKLGAAAAAIAVGGIMVYASEAHATSQKTQLSEKTYLVPVDSELGDAPILSLRQNFPEATRTIEKVAGASQAVIEPFAQGLRSIFGD